MEKTSKIMGSKIHNFSKNKNANYLRCSRNLNHQKYLGYELTCQKDTKEEDKDFYGVVIAGDIIQISFLFMLTKADRFLSSVRVSLGQIGVRTRCGSSHKFRMDFHLARLSVLNKSQQISEFF